MGYFGELATHASSMQVAKNRALIEEVRADVARVRELNEAGEHAWWLSKMPLCEQAARAERERTGHFGRGITKRYDADEVACEDCQAVIRNGGSKRHDLLGEIQADMLKRNPRLADPEWTVEDYRPLRNRR